jgi:capsular polysaccharide biosynthesis protein
LNSTPENTPLAVPASVPAAPAAETAPAAAPVKSGLALPFDPWRLVAALVRRWFIIVGVGVAVGGLGSLAGYLKFKAEYKAGAQLLRQESMGTFRASESGESFKPRQLSVPTLVSFMKSPAVVQRVAEQAHLPVRTIVQGLTITPERNTDLINLSFISIRSAQTAVRVLNAFGNEVVRLTKEMQALEAGEMNRLLKRQLAKAEEDLRAVNNELLEFSRQAGLISVDRETEAYLRSLGELDMRYATMQIEHDTLDLKINALERELATNNPLTDRLAVARERLNELLQQFTPANPHVQEQKAVVADLEARLKDSETKPVAAPRQNEGGISVGFYTELLTLKTQKKVTAAQLEKLKTVRAGVDDKLRGLPEKGMQIARIKARLQSLEAAQALLASRQHEAQLYEENSLSYYRFFESKLDEVEVAGRSKKVLLLAVAGGVLGLLFAVAVVCLVESLDDRIKTPADLKRVTRLPLFGTLPDLEALDAVGQSNWAFRTWLALQSRLAAGPRRVMMCGFVSAAGREGCSTWVELLARAAAQRDEKVIVITNRAPVNGSTMPLDEALANPSAVSASSGRPQWLIVPPAWRWDGGRRRQWKSAIQVWSQTEGLVALVELTAADQPETLSFAEEMPQLVWLTRSGLARGSETAERLQTFQHAGCRFVGAVLNCEIKLFPWG